MNLKSMKIGDKTKVQADGLYASPIKDAVAKLDSVGKMLSEMMAKHTDVQMQTEYGMELKLLKDKALHVCELLRNVNAAR